MDNCDWCNTEDDWWKWSCNNIVKWNSSQKFFQSESQSFIQQKHFIPCQENIVLKNAFRIFFQILESCSLQNLIFRFQMLYENNYFVDECEFEVCPWRDNKI